MEYLTQIQTYKNTNVPIDTYIFHYGMTEWFQCLILRALRRVLKKDFNVEIPLIESYEKVKENYKSAADKVVNDILTNEKYLGKSIIPIPVSCVVVPEENPEGEEGENLQNEEKKIQGKEEKKVEEEKPPEENKEG